MTGGRVIISGSCPPPGDGATMREITSNELDELAESSRTTRVVH